jgi:acyl-coenzyme A synthetase/AMP-(fatty) acid ligase
MMSGDWVPVSLPGRIRNLFQNVEIVALGGATEGSIWSNHFEIPEVVPEDWKSIPYGKPLANQKYYVLDQNMEDCPDWVPGTLYIAGDGIAQGYLNDKEKTEEKFVVLDRTGERLYCTGDMGRYWNDGNIEFLGRLDNQVKINGYRVELGEIEAAINRFVGIRQSKVVCVDKKNLLALNAFQILEFDYGDAKLAGDYFSFLKDSKELREIEERKVIINDLKLFAQIQNRGIDAFITKDRKSLPKMIDPLKANKELNFEFFDLTVPIKDVLGLLF